MLQVFLADQRSWLDGGSVYRRLLDQAPPTSLPSVYRSLKALERHDLLARKWSDGVTGGKASYIFNDIDAPRPRCDVTCRYCGTHLSMRDSELTERIRQFVLTNEQLCQHQPATLQVTCKRCDQSRHGRRPAIFV